MYESFFRLSQRPFVPAPLAAAYVATGTLEQARQNLVRCLDRGEGPGLVIGPTGIGKSLLCQLLAQHFRDRFHVALLAGAQLATRRALLQNILFELKLPYRGLDESELRLSLVDHLDPRSGGRDGLLLLVDEGHTLPLRLLEEVRLLTNLVHGGQSRVRLVLAGGMALEERLTSPKLESFHQRIAVRCYLQPLGREETIHYVQEQVRRVGGKPDRLFSDDAMAAIYTASDGIPRLINQLCDHALMLAALGGQRQLDSSGIDEAWADLQQLPVPLHEPRALGAGKDSSAGVVEFGQLGEEPAGRQTIRTAALGAAPKTHEEAAVARLDAIDRGIQSIDTGDPLGVISGTAADALAPVPADDFAPAPADTTEVELIFHSAHDPFGGQWEEEEVIIDRYATLDDAALRHQKRPDPPVTIAPMSRPLADRDDEDDPAHTIAASADFHPASDPLLPDDAALPTRPRRATISLRSIAADDRDMIVVEDDPPIVAPLATPTRRPEYRQLFSNLRKT
jgi:type II secretory pathway predicted ATPase ExeA